MSEDDKQTEDATTPESTVVEQNIEIEFQVSCAQALFFRADINDVKKKGKSKAKPAKRKSSKRASAGADGDEEDTSPPMPRTIAVVTPIGSDEGVESEIAEPSFEPSYNLNHVIQWPESRKEWLFNSLLSDQVKVEIFQLSDEADNRLPLGSCFVDLSALVKGEHMVSGWYGLSVPEDAVEFCLENKPQIQVSAKVADTFLSEEDLEASNLMTIQIEELSPSPWSIPSKPESVSDSYTVAVEIPIGRNGETLPISCSTSTVASSLKEEEGEGDNENTKGQILLEEESDRSLTKVRWGFSRDIFLCKEVLPILLEKIRNNEGFPIRVTGDRQAAKPKEKVATFHHIGSGETNFRPLLKPGASTSVCACSLHTVVEQENVEKEKKGKSKAPVVETDVFEKLDSKIEIRVELKKPLNAKRAIPSIDDVIPEKQEAKANDVSTPSVNHLQKTIEMIVEQVRLLRKENEGNDFVEFMEDIRKSDLHNLLRTKLRESVIEVITANMNAASDERQRDIDEETNVCYAYVMNKIASALEEDQSTICSATEMAIKAKRMLSAAQKYMLYDCPSIAETRLLDIIAMLETEEQQKNKELLSEAWQELAIFHLESGHKELGESCVQQVLQMDPSDKMANLMMGLLLMEEDKMDEAFAFIHSSWQRDANDPLVMACKSLYHMLAEEDSEWMDYEERTFTALGGGDPSNSAAQTIISRVSEFLCKFLSRCGLHRLVVCSVLRNNVDEKGEMEEGDVDRSPASISRPSPAQNVFLARALSTTDIEKDMIDTILDQVISSDSTKDKLDALALKGHSEYAYQNYEDVVDAYKLYLSEFRESESPLSDLDPKVLYRYGCVELVRQNAQNARQIFQQLNDIPDFVSSHTLAMYAIACLKQAEKPECDTQMAEELLFVSQTALSQSMVLDSKTPSMWAVLSRTNHKNHHEQEAKLCKNKSLSFGFRDLSSTVQSILVE